MVDGARIRARVRDEAGAPRQGARVVAEVLEGSLVVHRIELVEGAAGDGIYEGTSPSLTAVADAVRARVEDDGAAPAVELPIRVEPAFRKEDVHRSWDELMLRRIAEAGGGAYLREEEFATLPRLLEPLSPVDVSEERRDLSRSAWWLGVIVSLLTAEWILRRRWGLL